MRKKVGVPVGKGWFAEVSDWRLGRDEILPSLWKNEGRHHPVDFHQGITLHA